MPFRFLLSAAMLFGISSLTEGREFAYQVLKKPVFLNVRTTAYTHTEADHIAYGRLNAYGSELEATEEYHSAAADWSFLPLGTVFRMKEFGERFFIIDDYGSALTGKDTVDLYFMTEEEMNEWGAKRLQIEILRIGDYRASYEILRKRVGYPHCYAMAKRIKDLYDEQAKKQAKSDE